MKFSLPTLPYAYDALEPYIDARTMELHHTKHHQAYINNLNAALERFPEFVPTGIEALLLDLPAVPEAIRTTVRNNAGGHFNHSFFWKLMKKNGGGEPIGLLAQKIRTTFGSFEEYQSLFNAQAKAVFGSGWAWLSVDQQGELIITGLPNQDCPLSYNAQPVIGLDVWEHAYYLQYQNKRPDYIDAWWHVINREQAEENYRAIIE